MDKEDYLTDKNFHYTTVEKEAGIRNYLIDQKEDHGVDNVIATSEVNLDKWVLDSFDRYRETVEKVEQMRVDQMMQMENQKGGEPPH